MKTMIALCASLALAGCANPVVRDVEHKLEYAERHAVKAEVDVLTEATMLGVDALKRLHDDTGRSLDHIRRTLGPAK